MSENIILGIEGGGTKTDWILLQGSEVLQQGQSASANLRLISDERLLQLFRDLPTTATHVGAFLAGCMDAQDRQRLLNLVQQVWPGANIAVGSDRESSFAAAFEDRDGIVVNSGTGASVTGRKQNKIENAGGRGHLLGDRGGGYILAIEGLRIALEIYDLKHRTTPLAQSILRALSLNSMEDLVSWIQSADKMAIAKLTPVVFEAAGNGDMKTLRVLKSGATRLAKYTQSVARRLRFKAPDVKLVGGVFRSQQLYVQLFRGSLKRLLPQATVELNTKSGAWGAAWLASKVQAQPQITGIKISLRKEELAQAVTEQPNPRSATIDQMPLSELIDLFVEEEAYVSEALGTCSSALRDAVELATRSLSQGGRLFYVGAGTSGRLGVLDASEIPPTFGESPDRVQAIIAGGMTAIHRAVEGAEDDEDQGALAISQGGINSADVVCGITASGRTPFVFAALKKAKEIGARTILLTCNPARNHIEKFDVEIDLPTGPELITGSTRLKAGTATKVALNILSTCTMIRLGKVKGNWMIHLNASSSKLKDRAIRLVSRLRRLSYEDAEDVLKQNDWRVQKVLKKD